MRTEGRGEYEKPVFVITGLQLTLAKLAAHTLSVSTGTSQYRRA